MLAGSVVIRLSRRFLQWRVAFYFGSVIFSLALLQFFVWRIGKLRLRDPQSYAAVVRFHRFANAASAGIMGSQSVLFAKATSQLLVNTFTTSTIM